MMRRERDERLVERGSYELHAWLDGEGTELAARRASATRGRDVELWKRVDAEASRRRAEGAPSGLRARILAALPEDVALTSSATPARPLGD